MSNRQPPMVDMLNAEIMRIPPPMLPQLKQEMGLGDKDMAALSVEEKVCSDFRVLLSSILGVLTLPRSPRSNNS